MIKNRLNTTLVVVTVLAFSGGNNSNANPDPGSATVVSGSASFSQPNASTLNITNSPGTIINWQQFGIGANEVTRFIQQSSSSAVLNRITGQNPSQILGTLISNGRVFLVNPNGVIFGRHSVIDTAGLITSTLNISNNDFLNGTLHFEDFANNAAILNQGFIHTAKSGEVVLIAPNVTNEGIIDVEDGNLLLAAGQSITVSSLNYDNIEFEVQAPDNKVINIGTLLSDGGSIGVFAGSIQNKGTVSANAITVDAAGNIKFVAKNDAVVQNGTVTATSETGEGGHVEILGNRVGLFGESTIDASGATAGGEVLIGGDYQGSGDAKTATQTQVSSNSTIKADATESGNGGKVIVWADQNTYYYGNISATGGYKSGDGGFVEVSGKNNLAFNGVVDVSAPSGTLGTILLDPNNITIQAIAGGDDGSLNAVAPNIAFIDGGTADFVIGEAALEALTGDVILQAEINILVENGVTLDFINQTAGIGVSFLAGGNIDIDGTITLSGGDLALSAGDPSASSPSATAAITLANTGSIITNGGSVTLNTNDATGGAITVAGNIDSSGNTIAFNSENDASFTSGTITASTLSTFGAGELAVNNGVTFDGVTLQNATMNSTGIITINGALTLNAGSELHGNGIFNGNVLNNAGTVQPGGAGATDILAITGNYTQGALGALLIELQGTTAGTGYDRLLVGGTATLDGNLVISEINGFSAGILDTFDNYLSTGGLTGNFSKRIFPVGYALPSSTAVNQSIDYKDDVTVFFDNATTNLEWNDANNWSSGIVPTAGLDVDTATLVTGGTILISGGTHNINNLITGSGITNTGGNLTVAGNVTVPIGFIYTQNSAGTVTQFDGIVNDLGQAGVLVNITDGTLQGSGTVIADVVNDGTLAPGNPLGTFTVDGDLTLLANSNLILDIAGLSTAGIDYDLLSVTGNINLDGTLTTRVDATSYTAQLGDTFNPLVTGGVFAGTFTNVVNNQGFAYDLVYTSTTLDVITVAKSGLTLPVDLVSETLTFTKNLESWKQDSVEDIARDIAAEEKKAEENATGQAKVCS